MNLQQTMTALEKLGNEQTRKTWLRHGATGELFGVRIGDMKKLLKDLKGRQDVAMQLYATGNLDAMYLAGLVADGGKMSRKDLDTWVKAARWGMIAEYTVPWVASENENAREIALKWMDSKQEHIACAGWNTYASLIAMQPDSELDLKEIESLLERVVRDIGKAPNRVRYCMNGFVIYVGSFVKPLLAKAKATAKKLGKVEVDVGDTECKVPDALGMITKIESMGRTGQKRKSIKC
jgi:3-methyladenine DNA glycosylase AlkD